MKKRFSQKTTVVLTLVITLCFIVFGTSIVSADGPTWSDKDSWDAPDVGYLAAPALADLDNDGDYDLLIGEEMGSSYAYENTGTASSPIWTKNSDWDALDVGSLAAPAFADLDNDGDYDLLIGEYNGVSFAYENTGTASNPAWTEKSAWNAPDVGLFAAPALADLDYDGDYDLLIREMSGNSYAYENTGTASNPAWTEKSEWDAPVVEGTTAPALADLDHDGDYDLMMGEDDGASYAYENTGTASSPIWTKNSDWDVPNVGVAGWVAPALADLDHDGDYDVLIGGYYGNSYAYENTDPTPPVPEASTLLMISIGLISLLSVMYVKKKIRKMY